MQMAIIPGVMIEAGPLAVWRGVILWAAGGFAAFGLLVA